MTESHKCAFFFELKTAPPPPAFLFVTWNDSPIVHPLPSRRLLYVSGDAYQKETSKSSKISGGDSAIFKFALISESLQQRMPFSAPSSGEEPMSLAGLITGSNCLKTCGMEDMQYAARVCVTKVSDLFVTVRLCAVVLTSLLALYFVLLIALHIYNLNAARQKRSNICSGGKHFESNEKQKEFCCCSSSTSSLSSSSAAQPAPILSHPQLCRSVELPRSHDTTAAVTPLPIPPPSICRPQSAEGEDDGSGGKPNSFLTQCQFGSPTKQQFDSLSDYLLARRMTANVDN